MARLIELAPGNYADMSLVAQVVAFQQAVAVIFTNGRREQFPCEDYDAAKEMAQRIAEQVNTEPGQPT